MDSVLLRAPQMPRAERLAGAKPAPDPNIPKKPPGAYSRPGCATRVLRSLGWILAGLPLTHI